MFWSTILPSNSWVDAYNTENFDKTSLALKYAQKFRVETLLSKARILTNFSGEVDPLSQKRVFYTLAHLFKGFYNRSLHFFPAQVISIAQLRHVFISGRQRICFTSAEREFCKLLTGPKYGRVNSFFFLSCTTIK